MLLLGNPVVWWFGAVAAIWSVVAWVGRRDWRYGLVVIGIAVTWLPWLRYDDRPIFSYYAIVILPFLILGATMLLGEMLGRADASAVRRAVGAAAVGQRRGAGDAVVRVVLADLDRPADHQPRVGAADVVPALDLAPSAQSVQGGLRRLRGAVCGRERR